MRIQRSTKHLARQRTDSLRDRSTSEMAHDRAKQPGTERLILASASPRRRELLRYLDVPFEAVATDGEDQDILPPPELMRALPPFPHDRRDHPTILAWRKVNAAIE